MFDVGGADDGPIVALDLADVHHRGLPVRTGPHLDVSGTAVARLELTDDERIESDELDGEGAGRVNRVVVPDGRTGSGPDRRGELGGGGGWRQDGGGSDVGRIRGRRGGRRRRGWDRARLRRLADGRTRGGNGRRRRRRRVRDARRRRRGKRLGHDDLAAVFGHRSIVVGPDRDDERHEAEEQCDDREADCAPRKTWGVRGSGGGWRGVHVVATSSSPSSVRPIACHR